MKKYFTIGEIFRGGMLLDARGKPYAQKSTVALIVRRLKFRVLKTKWGPGKALSISQIKKHNARVTKHHVSKAGKN